MQNDRLQQLEMELQQLQHDLQATQTRMHALTKQLHDLQGHAATPTPQPAEANFFKSPYPFRGSLEHFIGLRLIHLVGIVVLVIGLSIGVKYAIDQQLISEVARIGLAYAAGFLLYLLSWALRKKYTAFSAILFSGAMASLYVTSYAAFVYYALLPAGAAFALMIVLTLFTVYQALGYNRPEIAILGLVGAYAIPFLISSNSGRAELLFAYISIINTAVIYLAFKRGWRQVAVLAQLITWVLLLGWSLTRFSAAQFATAAFFGSFFFLLFAGYALAWRLLRRQALQPVQAHLLLANVVLLYTLMGTLWYATFPKTGFQFLNGGFALFAITMALLVHRFWPGESYLKRTLALLAILFFLILITNVQDGFKITLLWLLTAVAVFAVGILRKATWLRLAAMVLMGVTLVKLVLLDSQRFTTVQKISAYLVLGVLLLVVGFFYQRFNQKVVEANRSATH